MTPAKKRFAAFAAATLMLIAVAIELTLQAAYQLSPTVEFQLALPGTVSKIDDERLGWRGHPGNPQHDRKGFRNPYVPKRADVVAMGDSQTYGYHVQADEAWPRRLEESTGLTSYSMAYGGYGPVHSLLLWDEAMALQPKVVIEAMYSGNDLFEAFKLVYYENQAPWLKSTEPTIINTIERAEKDQTVKDKISRVYWMGQPPVISTPKLTDSALRNIISKYYRTYGLLRTIKNAAVRAVYGKPPRPEIETDWDVNKQYVSQHKDYCIAFEDGSIRTVMNPFCRALAMDLDDPRIAEGHRIALRANRAMAQRAREAGIEFIVLMIPTKELVFSDVVLRSGFEMPIAYYDAVKNERRMWQATKRYFDQHEIEYIDPLDTLRQRLADGAQPFHISLDTHLNPEGHRVVTELINTHLADQNKIHHPPLLASKP